MKVARPHDDEVAGGVHPDGREPLTARGVRIDPELRPGRSAGSVVALAEHALHRAVLADASPDHDEVSEAIGGDVRGGLMIRREAVDAELRAHRRAGAREALAEDASGRTVLQIALPDDDEVAGGVGGDRGPDLEIGRVRVDPELRAHGIAGDIVALAEDAIAGSVLWVALPDNHELARGVRGDALLDLEARGEGIDVELRTERDTGAVEALPKETVGFLQALALPYHHELAGSIGGDVRGALATRRIGVDAELRPDGISLRPGHGRGKYDRCNEEKGESSHRRCSVGRDGSFPMVSLSPLNPPAGGRMTRATPSQARRARP